MTGAEARLAREALGLTQEEMAASFGMTPAVVAGWEDGRVKVPRHVRATLQWTAAQIERRDALAASGLPTCDWIQAFEREPEPGGPAQQKERHARLNAHMGTCEVCKARVAYIADRFPPMPRPPVTGWMAIVLPIFERVRRLPEWAQPPAIGAIVCLAYSLIKLVFVLPQFVAGGISGVLVVLAGFAASAAIGIVGGFVYVLYRRLRGPRLEPADRQE
jgi:transcriptional regulator with XRE-family HTH domain